MLAHRALPGRRAKRHASHGVILFIAYPILQVLSHPTAVAQVMITVQCCFQLPPGFSVPALADFVQPQRNHLFQGASYRAFPQDRPAGRGCPTRTGRGFHPHRRQFDPTLLLHFQQQGSRRHVFELPLGRAPVPEPGQFTAEPITAPVTVLADQNLNLRQLFRAERSALKHRR